MNMWLGAAVAAGLALHAPAWAEDPGAAIAASGNGRGSVACSTCHGADGAGNAAAGFPRIAGMGAGYLRAQLTAFRDGQRTSAVMATGVNTLNDEEIAAVAAYYAGLPAPAVTAQAPSEADAALAKGLVELGDWPGRDLPSCVSCHGPGLVGVGEAFPLLAGQHAPYLVTQLTAFKEGTRDGGPGDLMGTVARKLTDEEITAVSAWLAALSAGGDQ